jgi:hypothetical protein
MEHFTRARATRTRASTPPKSEANMAALSMPSVAALGGQGRATLSTKRSGNTKPNTQRSAGRGVKTQAFFKKKAPPPPPPPPPPKPTLFGGLFGGAKQIQDAEQRSNVRDFEYEPQETMTDAYARIRKKREQTAAKFEAKEKGGLSLFMFNALSAVNFEVWDGHSYIKGRWEGNNASRRSSDALSSVTSSTTRGYVTPPSLLHLFQCVANLPKKNKNQEEEKNSIECACAAA